MSVATGGIAGLVYHKALQVGGVTGVLDKGNVLQSKLHTPTPDSTISPTTTPIPTASPSRTASPTVNPSVSPSATPTFAPTVSPTASPSPTVSSIATPTPAPARRPSPRQNPSESPSSAGRQFLQEEEKTLCGDLGDQQNTYPPIAAISVSERRFGTNTPHPSTVMRHWHGAELLKHPHIIDSDPLFGNFPVS